MEKFKIWWAAKSVDQRLGYMGVVGAVMILMTGGVCFSLVAGLRGQMAKMERGTGANSDIDRLKERIAGLETNGSAQNTHQPGAAEMKELRERVERLEASAGKPAHVEHAAASGRAEAGVQYLFMSAMRGGKASFSASNEQQVALIRSYFPADRFTTEVGKTAAPHKKGKGKNSREPASVGFTVNVKAK